VEDDSVVEISVGDAPDHIDHSAPVARVPAAAGEAVLEDLPAGRHYVHVAPVGGVGIVAATRLVPLQGTMNFRDLGGYRTGDGRRVRWGLVFRSDGLQDLTDDDLALLRLLGIRVVHDFRYDLERQRRPSRLPADGSILVEALTIGGEAGQEREILDLVMAGEITEIGMDFMIDTYVEMLESGAASFGRLLTSLADRERLPALFHCTAGKDRTGVAAALLLSLLGVDEETILDDYELSTIYRSDRRIEQLRPTLEAAGVIIANVRPFLSAPRPALAAALAAAHERHGSVEGYVTEQAGVPPAAIEALRRLLLA
jgi:protein-tyrosine phosphatase